jgi:hypothetical protein
MDFSQFHIPLETIGLESNKIISDSYKIMPKSHVLEIQSESLET